MIKPYNTTIEHTHTTRAQKRGLMWALSALLLSLALPLSASPLERLKLLLSSEGEGARGALEVSARSLAWSEGDQALSLKGEVRLWRSLKVSAQGAGAGEGEGAQRVELRCEALEARFNPQRAQALAEGALEGLTSFTLRGGVSLSAPGLSLTARRAHWEAAEGVLNLTGGVEGRWGAQRVRASHAQVWLERGALIAEGVRATLTLPRRRPPSVSLER